IGANIGLYSLQFATLGSIEKIYAFEPDPRNNTQLKSNIFLNDFIDKILVCDYAASDKKAEVSFELYPNHSTGQSRIVESGKSENKVITIPCDTIDNNFDFSNDNIAIKIDVEGNELATLAGAKKLLASNTCIVQIEAWPENAEKLKKYMEDLDYKFLKLIAEDHYFTNDPKLVG
ncbi:MAG: FkbM family methyltransferase, partial [Pseudomonadota bacterium]